MDRLQNIETFVRVAQAQSFTEAARQLRVSRSVVTARIKQLEDHVGSPLFHRSTRMVRLTETGQLFLRESTELVAQANALVEQMRESGESPSGTLRLHALTGLVLGHLPTLLKDFQLRYPDIQIELSVSDAIVDPTTAGVDCALQIFSSTATDIISKHLFPVRRVLCASPAYLAKHGVPKDPRDLHGHRLGLYSRYPSRDRWVFHHKGQDTTVYLAADLFTNSVHLLREYALEDAALVCVPTLVAAPALLDGSLQLVLCDHQLSAFWLSAVYARTSRNAFKLRLFLDHLQDSFSTVPPWDASLISRGLLQEDVRIE